jgi:tellurite resistance-related uncharacterized protein
MAGELGTALNNGKHVAHAFVEAHARANARRQKLSALHGAVCYRVMDGATACLPQTLCNTHGGTSEYETVLLFIDRHRLS